MLLLLLLLLLLLHTAFSTPPPSTPDLVAWLRDQGGKGIPGVVRIDHHAMGGSQRGLVATRAVRRGELLFEVPLHLMITHETARADAKIGRFIRALDLDARESLVLFLIHHRWVLREASRYWPYLASLPPRGPSFPAALCCSAAARPLNREERARLCRVEFALWGACPTAHIVAERRRLVHGAFGELETRLFARHREAFPAPVFTRAAHAWAHAVVASRSFSLHVRHGDGDGLITNHDSELRSLYLATAANERDHDASKPRRTKPNFLVLVPFADLLNHHYPSRECGGGGQAEERDLFDDDPSSCAGGIWFNATHLSTTAYWFHGGARAFRVHADADYAAGDEVRISYGRKSTPELLLAYGFTVAGGDDTAVGVDTMRQAAPLQINPFDTMLVSASALIPLVAKTARAAALAHLAPLKRAILRAHGLEATTREDYRVHVRGTVTAALLATLRTRALDDHDLHQLRVIHGKSPDDLVAGGGHADFLDVMTRPITPTNEASVRLAIAAQCEQALRRVEAAKPSSAPRSTTAESGLAEPPGWLELLDHHVERWRIQTAQLLRACVLQSFASLGHAYEAAVTARAGGIGAADQHLVWHGQMQAYKEKWLMWWRAHAATIGKPLIPIRQGGKTKPTGS